MNDTDSSFRGLFEVLLYDEPSPLSAADLQRRGNAVAIVSTHGAAHPARARRALVGLAAASLIAAGTAAMAVRMSQSDSRSSSSPSEPAEVTLPTSPSPTLRFGFSGDAMAPTLRDGETITIEVRANPTDPLDRFAVVAITRTEDGASPRTLVKRVIGLAGDTIAFENCHVIVNGLRIDEPYVDLTQQRADGCGADQPELLVPEGTVFVLGDNRGRSSDSRAFGPVPLATVTGTVRMTSSP
jgi:signal peptidase I